MKNNISAGPCHLCGKKEDKCEETDTCDDYKRFNNLNESAGPIPIGFGEQKKPVEQVDHKQFHTKE